MQRHVCAVALLALTACAGGGGIFGPETNIQTSRVPVPTGFPLTTQATLESAQHWHATAQNLVERLVLAYRRHYPDAARPVFVAPMGTTAFGKNFRAFVVSSLSAQGVPVASLPDGAAVLEASSELIQHRWNHESSSIRNVVEPGFHQHPDESGRYQKVPVVREDRNAYTRYAPETEFILIASLYEGGNLIFQESSIFYIPQEERILYQKAPAISPSPTKQYILVE